MINHYQFLMVNVLISY